jgi:hypothetical protein
LLAQQVPRASSGSSAQQKNGSQLGPEPALVAADFARPSILLAFNNVASLVWPLTADFSSFLSLSTVSPAHQSVHQQFDINRDRC